jgi:ubiquinol-cytochrome c reductase cytochrome b subunit
MALTFWSVLTLAGTGDVIALTFHVSLNAVIWAGRILLVILPPLVYSITYRLCLGLQQHDREVLVHGIETGIIRRNPDGGYVEVHQPLPGGGRYAGAPVPKKLNQVLPETVETHHHTRRKEERCALPWSERPAGSVR